MPSVQCYITFWQRVRVHACLFECMYVYMHMHGKKPERVCLQNSVGGFLTQVCSHAVMQSCICVCLYVCFLKQVDRCEGWLLAQRFVGQSMVSKPKSVGITSSMESAPTYTRCSTDTNTHCITLTHKQEREAYQHFSPITNPPWVLYCSNMTFSF